MKKIGRIILIIWGVICVAYGAFALINTAVADPSCNSLGDQAAEKANDFAGGLGMNLSNVRDIQETKFDASNGRHYCQGMATISTVSGIKTVSSFEFEFYKDGSGKTIVVAGPDTSPMQ